MTSRKLQRKQERLWKRELHRKTDRVQQRVLEIAGKSNRKIE